MLRALRKSALAVGISTLPLAFAADSFAAKPTPSQALGLVPMQAGVDIDQPEKDEVDKCTLTAETSPGISGWVLETAGGRILRRFLDTNGDNRVDQWCYYKDGVEVYRDIDTDFKGKADQYRWLGTAGVRWGLDPDEDGKIDSWKMISPEEVSAEVVAAFRDGDAARFERLLITSAELKALGLGEAKAKEVSSKVAAAPGEFKTISKKQRVIGDKSEWVHFGGTQPGILPAGTDGATKDVVVYDNVSAVVETGKEHAQVAVGTLIRVGENWRIIDVPRNLLNPKAEVAADAGIFFLVNRKGTGGDATPSDGIDKATQDLINEVERLDALLATTPPEKQAKVHSQRCDALEKLISGAASAEDRGNWTRQYADTVNAAVQAGVFREGAKRLDNLFKAISKSKDGDLLAFVKFRAMSAAYNLSLQPEEPGKKNDYAAIQVKWQDDLEEFVKEYPRSPDASEAMLQLALALESQGKEQDSDAWYARIIGEFPTLALAKKSAGARKRLASVGKTIELKGKTLDGQAVDLLQHRGKTVVIHYWATWCGPCKEDMAELKRLQAKFAGKPFAIIGVNLDSEAAKGADYLRTNRYPWPQLYEDKGLEGRLATELGIWTLPTMLLIDKEGKVANRDIHIGELAIELEKRLK